MEPFIVTTAYLTEQLRPWLEYFSEGTARWGIVTDIRADGTTFKRHGVVVELIVESPDEFIDEERAKRTYDERGEQLREAIDLVKLVLAVEPMALKPLLLHEDAPYDEEELAHLLHGKTPTELRVRFEFGNETKTSELTQRFVAYFLEQLHSRSHWASDELRRRLILLAHQNLRDVPGLRASSFRRLRLVPVPVTVLMDQFDPYASFAFFEGLTEFANALQSHNHHHRDTCWAMGELHSPLAVEEFDLYLNDLWVSRGVVHAAKAFLAAGIRVICSEISVDPRWITCGEADLTAFMRAITWASSSVYIETGRYQYRGSTGEHHQDWRDPIASVFRSIATIDKPVTINLTGLLLVHSQPMYRNAIFRGLFDAISTRSAPTNLTIGCCLRDEDVSAISRCQREWRLQNPSKRIRVAALELSLDFEESSGRALLATLDDVEDLTLRHYTKVLTIDWIRLALRFPSLRRLKVRNLSISSMELFDPSVEDPHLPNKPALEALEIEGLELDDPDSLRSFITRLDPSVAAPSPLVKTLQTLTITQYARVWFPIKGSLPGPCIPYSRPYYDDAAVAVLQETCRSNRTLRDVDFVGDRQFRTKMPDAQPARRLKTGHYLPAPVDVRHAASARARNASFLSVIRDAARDRKSAISRLDSRTMQLILDLSAPHVGCTLKLFSW